LTWSFSDSNYAWFSTLISWQAKNRVHEFQEEANVLLVNQVVMTVYNKKTYTVGGIESAKSVNSPYKSDGTGETFVEYYKRVLIFAFIEVVSLYMKLKIDLFEKSIPFKPSFRYNEN